MTYSFSKSRRLAPLAGAVALLVTPAAQAAIDIHWAVISGPGNLIKSSEAVSVSRTDTGTYAIDFGGIDNVARCALGATIGTTGSNIPGFGLIIAYQHPINNGVIVVETRDVKNNRANRAFHLIATCGQNQ